MKKRNATETKKLILDTAMQEFARCGFDGLRVDELALKAGINKATIYYHFKNKSFIFQKILVDVSQEILEKIALELENKSTSKDKLEAFLYAVTKVISTRRDYSKMMMQELAFNGKNITEDVKKEFFKIIAILINILNEGIKENIFKQIDPFLVPSVVIGGINYYLNMKELSENEENENFKVNLNDDCVKSINDMVLNYILI